MSKDHGNAGNGKEPFKVQAAGLTHVGMKRNHNEDSFFMMQEENLYVVADGMGGHASGEVASRMAVETIANFFKATADDDEITWPFKMDKAKKYQENRIITSIKLANLRIYEASAREAKYKGMGTTCVSSFFANGAVFISWVGDSRGYRVRGGEITQISEDHSLLNDYIKMKKLTAEEIENFPHKNVIVRALGMKDTVQVDVRMDDPRDGDIYLICSDGLSGLIKDAVMCDLVMKNQDDLEAGCNQLIAAANQNGGTDNITVVLSKTVKA